MERQELLPPQQLLGTQQNVMHQQNTQQQKLDTIQTQNLPSNNSINNQPPEQDPKILAYTQNQLHNLQGQIVSKDQKQNQNEQLKQNVPQQVPSPQKIPVSNHQIKDIKISQQKSEAIAEESKTMRPASQQKSKEAHDVLKVKQPPLTQSASASKNQFDLSRKSFLQQSFNSERSPNPSFNLKQGGTVFVSDIKRNYPSKEVDWDKETSLMTPRSQNKAKEYFDKILSPLNAFTQDFFENDKMIVQEQEFLKIDDYNIVTIKLIDNVLIYDDRHFAGIIDHEKVNQFSVPQPNQGCYLFSIYKHDLSKTIFLSFENKKLMLIDSASFQKKSSTQQLEIAILQFIQFHDDPKNHVLLASEKGIIQILRPSDSNIVENFDLERIFRNEENKNDLQDEEIGDIIEINRTIEINKTNEYMIAAKYGLFFAKIKLSKNPNSNEAKFNLALNKSEYYFKNQELKGAFEYDQDKIIAIVNDSKSIYFIDRKNKQAVEQINNLSNDKRFKCLRPLPNYNFKTFPYVLLKDSKCLNVINVRTRQQRVILRNSPYNWDVLRTQVMEFADYSGQGPITLFNLELESIYPDPNQRYQKHTSTINKLIIVPELLDSCFK